MPQSDTRPSPEVSARPHVHVIAAGRGDADYWRDLWRYRELFGMLAWRDLAVRYKQTVIGAAWAVLRPLLTMLIFTFVFGALARLPSDGQTPYAVMVLAGMLPWLLIAGIVNEGSASLVTNANLLGKVYFPRLIVPAATMLTAVVDFVIGMALLGVMLAVFQVTPDWRILFLPLFLALAVIVAFGPALLMAALNVKYRDFRYVIPFLVQLGLFVSPVGFSSSIVPEQWRWLYSLNPAVGVIDGFRWCLLGTPGELYWQGVAISAAMGLGLLALGIYVFRRMEATFADDL